METNDNPFADLQENNKEELPPPIYSYGSDPAFIKVNDLIDREGVDTVAINVLTLMRNVYDKNKTLDENLELLIDNIQNLKSNYSNYYYKQEIINPVLYFYLFNYENIIPDNYLRSNTTETKKILDRFKNRFIEYYTASYKQYFYTEPYENILVVFEIDDTPFNKPYHKLRLSISTFSNRHIVALHTHIPIDAHIFPFFKSYIVRSYQGDSYDINSYGLKIFGVDIPFIPNTHIVFGDKELIKGVVQRKQKKDLILQIQSEDWKLWSKNKISDKLNDMGLIPYKL